MYTADTSRALTTLASELIEGARADGAAFVLNSGDVGLLRSLDSLSAADASRSTNEGATIAAHAEHVRYGLSLMNRWAQDGGNPFANATWGDAWNIHAVDEGTWQEIRAGLRDEAQRWLQALRSPREVAHVELAGMIGSIAHLAYHLGAVRQIHKSVRGPKDPA